MAAVTTTPSAAVVPAAAASASASTTPRAEPTFTISDGQTSRTYTRSELLTGASTQTLDLADHAAYNGQTLTVRAVPVTSLLSSVTVGKSDTIEFDSLDGFSASLNPRLLLNDKSGGSTAYLAIEDPAAPWPKLGRAKSSAGPFYLMWKDPERSKVGQEQWPYQLRSFTVKASMESRFPAIQPASGLAPDHPARLGYEAFVKHCFACHTLNDQGNARLGPDLNIPHSPTEYLHEDYLRKLVRNPQNLRHWKGSQMSAFSKEALPDVELDHIIAYLQHKAEQRRSSVSP